jgi:hypothetical protein
MNAIEFSGKIEQGSIKLPLQFSDFENANVRVIMLFDEQSVLVAKKERLKLVFQQMEHQSMFSKIEDPLYWQKQVRNEWE